MSREGNAMKFWKFESPTEEQIQSLLAVGGPPPSVIVPGLLNTFEKVAKKLKPDDCVVLASLNGDEGKIVAFGRVRSVGNVPDEVSIQWAKASHGVHPTGSGLEHWRTKTAFEVSPVPAERYGLRRIMDFHIKQAA
jgi:hypothetical protein